MVGQAKVTMRSIPYLLPLHYVDLFCLTVLFSLAYPRMDSTFASVSRRYVENILWQPIILISTFLDHARTLRRGLLNDSF
jgi:hypothetical protein